MQRTYSSCMRAGRTIITAVKRLLNVVMIPARGSGIRSQWIGLIQQTKSGAMDTEIKKLPRAVYSQSYSSLIIYHVLISVKVYRAMACKVKGVSLRK